MTVCECKGCQQPAKLKGKPGECSPEQIRECHGEVEKHPCEAQSESADAK